MALIRVNNKEENLLGALSFDREDVYNEAGKPTGTMISGVLAVHDYIDYVHTIESERYKLTGIDVYKESFGSNEYMILYYFTAKNLEIKGDYIHDDIKWLMEEETIKEEIKNCEWYHSYLQEEAFKEVEKLVEKYKDK